MKAIVPVVSGVEELETVTIIDVLEIQREIDDLSKRFRELDTKIQQLNWTHDLI